MTAESLNSVRPSRTVIITRNALIVDPPDPTARLGLKLEPRREPLDGIVIDRIDRATENWSRERGQLPPDLGEGRDRRVCTRSGRLA